MQPSSQQHKIVLHHPMKPTNHNYKTLMKQSMRTFSPPLNHVDSSWYCCLLSIIYHRKDVTQHCLLPLGFFIHKYINKRTNLPSYDVAVWRIGDLHCECDNLPFPCKILKTKAIFQVKGKKKKEREFFNLVIQSRFTWQSEQVGQFVPPRPTLSHLGFLFKK